MATRPRKLQVCFETTEELRSAVDNLVAGTNLTELEATYGLPIGSWCVSQISDFSSLFSVRRNPAMATYVPIYAGVTDLPQDFKTDGRTTGFSRRSAWWAFNRASTIAAHRWGEMRKDVAAVRDPLQEKFLAAQPEITEAAVKMLKNDPAKGREYLTRVTGDACREATNAFWNLGDLLWTKYDEKW